MKSMEAVNDSKVMLLESALSYVNSGWYIFPVLPRGKRPLTSHGFKDASNDPDVIQNWWSRWPNANIGIACEASGIVVIDIDNKDNGLENWQDLRDEFNIDVSTVTSLTGGGGVHLFYAPPKDFEIGRHIGEIATGIDICGKGGYVILPPSIHVSGNQYDWELSSEPENCELLPFPEQLIPLIKKLWPKKNMLKDDFKIHEGNRDNHLISQAGSMRSRGFDLESIEAALLKYNLEHCSPPLADDDVRRIARSVMRYPAKIFTSEGGSDSSAKPVVKYIINKDTITSLFDRVLNKIAPSKRFFVCNNELVYLEPGIGIVPLNLQNLNGYLLKYFEIMNVIISKGGNEKLSNYQVISRNHINIFLSSPEIKSALPKLIQYTRTPIVDKDWHVISQPGYHEQQAVYYDGPIIKPVSTQHIINEMLKDVNWKEPSDCANFIGVIITGLTIDKWIGHHPLVALNGNKSQVGKSTLAKMLGIILGGFIPSTVSYNSNQAEFEKAIATEIDQNTPVLIVDNVKGKSVSSVLSSSVLERCVTDHYLNFRRLGSNTTINRLNDVIFITTMNESKLSKDLQNRDIPINLEIYERPHDVKYSIPNMNDWLLEHREQVLSELLGMICKWRELGGIIDSDVRHTIGVEWSQTIDSILRANGIFSFLENYEESNRSYDENYELMIEICEHYHVEDYKSPLEWAELLSDNSLKEKLTDKRGNLKSEKSQSIVVGRLFSDYSGEKIICESGEFTVDKKLIKKRPQKHTYKFQKLSNGELI